MFFQSIQAVDRPNKKWEWLYQHGVLTVKKRPLYRAQDKFLTLGSCFAEEIRKALTRQGIVCCPEYSRIQFDPARVKVDTLPRREHMNYYNTYSILQEVERAAGLWQQSPDDYWVVPRRDLVDGALVVGEGSLFQDPYRRLVFAKSRDELFAVLDQINTVLRAGFETADVCVFTLGMTEVFVKADNGKVCNQVPLYGGGAGLKETRFHASSYEENLDNMRRALRLLRQINPGVKVVITVSPVPLQRSFNENDIFVNNYESKCTLRAVAAQLCRDFDWVNYFPAFEMVWGTGITAYKPEDRLHVKESMVERIIGVFMASQLVTEEPAGVGEPGAGAGDRTTSAA